MAKQITWGFGGLMLGLIVAMFWGQFLVNTCLAR